jgi:uncharacterized membrane protein HdeD (DUF308 family)
MDSVIERAAKDAQGDLKKLRWAIGISGALAVALAIVILAWPDISLRALTILFGVYALVTGLVGLVAAIRGPVPQGRGWLALSSVLGIAVGVVVLVWTDMSALALLYVIGAYAIALGIITIGGAFWLPLLDNGDRALLALTGTVSILFGIVMFAKPGDGALVLLALIAAYLLVTGIAELVVAIGGKRLIEGNIKRSLAPSQPQPTH